MMGVTEVRPNVEGAQVADEEIRLQISLGKQHAAKFLVGCGVPFSVVVRVLAEPTKRRFDVAPVRGVEPSS